MMTEMKSIRLDQRYDTLIQRSKSNQNINQALKLEYKMMWKYELMKVLVKEMHSQISQIKSP